MKTKIGIFKIFFIPFPASTYVEKPIYNFVDFRTKSAGSSNYGGPSFGLRPKDGNPKLEYRNPKQIQNHQFLMFKTVRRELAVLNFRFLSFVLVSILELRISLRPFGGSGGEKIVEFVIRIRIPAWLERPAVLPLLWYRRLRYGYTFRRIPLTQGKYAIVDPDDHDRLSRHKWYVCKRDRTYYAIRGQWSPLLKKRLTISMHREVIDVPDGLYVDHINHHGWDNRKANLRPATPADNARNARYPKINTTSKYRGVWYNKKKKRWRAVIGINNTRKIIGNFRNEIDAAKAYDQAAKKYYKEFAILNFPYVSAKHISRETKKG